MRVACAVAVIILVAGCRSGESPTPQADQIDDALLNYTGRWEHVRDRRDGRSYGTSSRSWHAGDYLVFTYRGSGFVLYGVSGPNGGTGDVAVDGTYYGTAHFYSPQIQPHNAVFKAPDLPEGSHTVALVVSRTPEFAHRNYVNIDSIQVLHNP